MTFAELRKANELIHTVPIEKRDKKTGQVTVTAYSPVHQRINAFRSVYPEGMILTELISDEAERDEGVIVIKCTILTPDGRTLGIGHASEKVGSSFINSTSALENAETSAVGRALGMAGFGIDGGLASAEEVQNAILNQNKEETCADCGNPVTPVIKKDGTQWDVASMKSYSERKYGRCLCVDCMKKADKEKKENKE